MDMNDTVYCKGCKTLYVKGTPLDPKYGVCALCLYYLNKGNKILIKRNRIKDNLKSKDTIQENSIEKWIK